MLGVSSLRSARSREPWYTARRPPRSNRSDRWSASMRYLLCGASVVVATWEEVDPVGSHQIHEAMFLRDPARPHIGSEVLERLGLPDSLEGIPSDGFN